MILDFSQNGINLIFKIGEDGSAVLFELSPPSRRRSGKTRNFCPIADIHICGEDANAHHGAKHVGSSAGQSLKYRSHKYYANGFGNKLEIELADERLKVVAHYQFYNGPAAVRSWVRIRNVGAEPLGIEYISSLSYAGLENDSPDIFIPHNSWTRELAWKKYTLSELGFERTDGFSLKRIAVSNTGTWSSKEHIPMGALSDSDMALMWQIESNGSWQWELSDNEGSGLYLKLGGPSEQENGWYKQLAPGKSFESVKVCVAVGRDLDCALAQMTRYRRAIFEDNEKNRALPVIFNDFMKCLLADPTEKKCFEAIDKAAEAGAECYCMDAGWYADGHWWDSVGEWQPSEIRFPNGIKKVFDRVRERGMIAGIWLEIEVMGINSPALKLFDDSCFFMRHGKRVIDHSRYQLDFRSKTVRDYATSVIDRVVGEYGVGYIKFDYNIEIGSGTEVGADSFGDGLLEHNRAYLGWIDSIKSKYPELIIENCSSGGMRMDYAMLSKHHVQSTSDQEDYRHTAIIASNSATSVLPEQAAVWACPLAESDEKQLCFTMANSMLTRVHLAGEVMKLNTAQMGEVKRAIECYKSLRGKISGFLPFYPLGFNSYGAEWACVGYRTQSESYIAVWRMDGEKASVTLPIGNAAKVEKIYPLQSKGGLTLSEKGVTVTLPDKYSALIFKTE